MHARMCACVTRVNRHINVCISGLYACTNKAISPICMHSSTYAQMLTIDRLIYVHAPCRMVTDIPASTDDTYGEYTTPDSGNATSS
jgi:hypothetical protein